jgi:hypothetical protein
LVWGIHDVLVKAGLTPAAAGELSHRSCHARRAGSVGDGGGHAGSYIGGDLGRPAGGQAGLITLSSTGRHWKSWSPILSEDAVTVMPESFFLPDVLQRDQAARWAAAGR